MILCYSSSHYDKNLKVLPSQVEWTQLFFPYWQEPMVSGFLINLLPLHIAPMYILAQPHWVHCFLWHIHSHTVFRVMALLCQLPRRISFQSHGPVSHIIHAILKCSSFIRHCSTYCSCQASPLSDFNLVLFVFLPKACIPNIIISYNIAVIIIVLYYLIFCFILHYIKQLSSYI